MMKHKSKDLDKQIDTAITNAKEFASSDIRVIKASWKHHDRIELQFAHGMTLSIPRYNLQGLENATIDQAQNIKISPSGRGLHWPDLDADHYVPALLAGVFGNKEWMARLNKKVDMTKRAHREPTVIREHIGNTKVEMHTIIGINAVYYGVVDKHGITVWDRTVAFGMKKRFRAAGQAFSEAAAEQQNQAQLLAREIK